MLDNKGDIMSNTRRLTKKEMRIFAVGQLGWSILGGIINTWLVTFYLPTKESVAAGAKFYVPTGLIIVGVLTVLGLKFIRDLTHLSHESADLAGF